MSRTVFVCLLAVAALVPFQGASAQSSAASAPPTVLPGMFGDWLSSDATTPCVVTSGTIGSDVMADDGPDGLALREYGVKCAEHKSYERRDASRSKETVNIDLYQMIDPTAAYGAFTYLRPANMPASKLAEYAAVSQTRALIVVGNFLLDVTGERLNQSTEALSELIASLKSKADPRPYPTISQHLPIEGEIAGSEHYVLGPHALQKFLPVGSGDWVGFSQGAEAIIARFRKAKQEVTMLIVEYPTQQIAAKRYGAMTPIIHPIPDPPPSETHVATSLREADLVVIAFAPRSGEYPEALMKQVTFGHNVTSNEGKFKATELSMPVYIVGAFVGAGAIMLIAIFSGLGFAVVRIVVKKFFPGKVFDRRQTMEVIQLGISDHKVNMKDFY